MHSWDRPPNSGIVRKRNQQPRYSHNQYGRQRSWILQSKVIRIRLQKCRHLLNKTKLRNHKPKKSSWKYLHPCRSCHRSLLYPVHCHCKQYLAYSTTRNRPDGDRAIAIKISWITQTQPPLSMTEYYRSDYHQQKKPFAYLQDIIYVIEIEMWFTASVARCPLIYTGRTVKRIRLNWDPLLDSSTPSDLISEDPLFTNGGGKWHCVA